MRVIAIGSVADLPGDMPGLVLGMGTMDGIHLGHQRILERVRLRAATEGGTAAVLTFAQHPLEIVRPEAAPPLLTPLPLKLHLLERLGMAAALVIHFSRAMADLEAADFVQTVLVERLRVAGLCVGYDFGFGKGRRGDVDLLRALAPTFGFWLEVVPPVQVEGVVVSSRLIRGLLAEGRVKEAMEYLGRPYVIQGEVEQGSGRGRRLGFATANVAVPPPLPLGDGVYAGRVFVRGAFQDALMNLGSAPTFGRGERRLEVHVPGWGEPLYGERVSAFFLQRLRDEQSFPDAAALSRQLQRDRADAESVWADARGLPWPDWTLHT